jgi:hypothetical protein
MSFRFRPHCGSLADALAEEQTFETRADLQAWLDRQWGGGGRILSIEKYGRDLDTRISPPYNTHIVMTDGWGVDLAKYPLGSVAGFTDGPVPED